MGRFAPWTAGATAAAERPGAPVARATSTGAPDAALGWISRTFHACLIPTVKGAGMLSFYLLLEAGLPKTCAYISLRTFF